MDRNFGPRLSQDAYLKKMRSAICYKMNVSRASGAACGSSYGRFCIFIWVENVSTADSDRGRLVLSDRSEKKEMRFNSRKKLWFLRKNVFRVGPIVDPPVYGIYYSASATQD